MTSVKLTKEDETGISSLLELAAVSEGSMKAVVTAANRFAGQTLPFHGRGGKIDRMLKVSVSDGLGLLFSF